MLINKSSTPTIAFLLVDATDDETAETGLSPTVQISKNGGAFANTTSSATEIANGWYKVALTSTETGTEGELILRATGTGADEWRDVHQVVDFANFKATVSSLASQTSVDAIAGYVDTEVAAILAAVDTEVAAIKAKTDNLPASPAAVGSAMTLADSAITAAKIATDAITAAKIAADAVSEIQSGLATAASIAALNDVSALDIWTYATRELTSGGGGASAADIWTYAGRTLTDDTSVVDGIATDVAALPTAVEIADAVLSRGAGNVEDTADLLSLAELILATFEAKRTAGSLTIYKANHSDVFNTRTYTTDDAAEPITEVN
jgi:hypothetical protein